VLIAVGKQRRDVGYATEAERCDEGVLRLGAAWLLRRLRLAALSCYGVALSTFVWLRADDWTVPGSQLAHASGVRARPPARPSHEETAMAGSQPPLVPGRIQHRVWLIVHGRGAGRSYRIIIIAGVVAVASTVLALWLGLRRLLLGAEPPLPVAEAAELVEGWWREHTEVEDKLLQELALRTDQQAPGGGDHGGSVGEEADEAAAEAAAAGRRRAQVPPVSRSCACIGSPCLRHCVHGASIGGVGGVALCGRQLAAAAAVCAEGAAATPPAGGHGGAAVARAARVAELGGAGLLGRGGFRGLRPAGLRAPRDMARRFWGGGRVAAAAAAAAGTGWRGARRHQRGGAGAAATLRAHGRAALVRRHPM
jgi:hypothetical protein